jgi:hypothetical protein
MPANRALQASTRSAGVCRASGWHLRAAAAATPLAWLLAASALAWAGSLAFALARKAAPLGELVPESLVALTRLGSTALLGGSVLGIVVLGAYWHRPPLLRLPRPVLALALLHAVVLALLAGLPIRASHSPHPDVILVVVDTLRADYVDASRTPNIHELGKDGYRFSRAYASAPWTLPSFGSLLTGLHARDHGAGVDLEKDLGDGRRPLRDDVETLAERFASHGYQTISLTTNPWLGPGSGIERGFMHFRNLLLDDVILPGTFEFTSTARFAGAPTQTDRALWLFRLRDPERPIFLMLHYMDTHQPRNPPRRLIDEERNLHPASESEITYGASVRLVDAELGRLMAALKRSGRYTASVLVVTSDHGEGLAEQGIREGHGKTLHPELVRIPLVLKPAADGSTRHCDGLISHIDLGSTLLHLAGFDGSLGVGLSQVTSSGGCADGADAVFHAITSIPPSRDGLAAADHAIVWEHPEQWLGYDLELDPDHQQPAAIAADNRLEEHVRTQRELSRRSVPWKTRELDPELVDTLRALGYLQ